MDFFMAAPDATNHGCCMGCVWMAYGMYEARLDSLVRRRRERRRTDALWTTYRFRMARHWGSSVRDRNCYGTSGGLRPQPPGGPIAILLLFAWEIRMVHTNSIRVTRNVRMVHTNSIRDACKRLSALCTTPLHVNPYKSHTGPIGNLDSRRRRESLRRPRLGAYPCKTL